MPNKDGTGPCSGGRGRGLGSCGKRQRVRRFSCMQDLPRAEEIKTLEKEKAFIEKRLKELA